MGRKRARAHTRTRSARLRRPAERTAPSARDACKCPARRPKTPSTCNSSTSRRSSSQRHSRSTRAETRPVRRGSGERLPSMQLSSTPIERELLGQLLGASRLTPASRGCRGDTWHSGGRACAAERRLVTTRPSYARRASPRLASLTVSLLPQCSALPPLKKKFLLAKQKLTGKIHLV